MIHLVNPEGGMVEVGLSMTLFKLTVEFKAKVLEPIKQKDAKTLTTLLRKHFKMGLNAGRDPPDQKLLEMIQGKDKNVISNTTYK